MNTFIGQPNSINNYWHEQLPNADGLTLHENTFSSKKLTNYEGVQSLVQ